MIHKGAVVIGMLIGAVVGVLIAPDKGSITRHKLKKQGKEIKDKLASDFVEAKDELIDVAISGKDILKSEFNNMTSKSSYKADDLITFLETQLSALKEKNNTVR